MKSHLLLIISTHRISQRLTTSSSSLDYKEFSPLHLLLHKNSPIICFEKVKEKRRKRENERGKDREIHERDGYERGKERDIHVRDG